MDEYKRLVFSIFEQSPDGKRLFWLMKNMVINGTKMHQNKSGDIDIHRVVGSVATQEFIMDIDKIIEAEKERIRNERKPATPDRQTG